MEKLNTNCFWIMHCWKTILGHRIWARIKAVFKYPAKNLPDATISSYNINNFKWTGPLIVICIILSKKICAHVNVCMHMLFTDKNIFLCFWTPLMLKVTKPELWVRWVYTVAVIESVLSIFGSFFSCIWILFKHFSPASPWGKVNK